MLLTLSFNKPSEKTRLLNHDTIDLGNPQSRARQSKNGKTIEAITFKLATGGDVKITGSMYI